MRREGSFLFWAQLYIELVVAPYQDHMAVAEK